MFVNYYIYILKSLQTGQYYIGQTQNLEKRIVKHNSGYVNSTSKASPWQLIYSEQFETRSDSVKREKEIKGWKSRARIEKLVAHWVPENQNSSNS